MDTVINTDSLCTKRTISGHISAYVILQLIFSDDVSCVLFSDVDFRDSRLIVTDESLDRLLIGEEVPLLCPDCYVNCYVAYE